MFEYTKNNHFKFGYQDCGWYMNRTNPSQRFVCDYGRATSVLGYREANIAAAKYIESIATDDIAIMLSGGADSEVAAMAFIDAGVPFRASILRFENGLNAHDIQYAEKFCTKHNITIDYYDLDVETYVLSQEFEDTVKAYQTTCERAVTLWAANKIPHFAILGQGEPVILKLFGRYWFQEKERICSWNKFWLFNDRPGIPGFHQFTPEQILSVFLDDMTVEMVKGRNNFWHNDRFKHAFYQKHYPELQMRAKYSGWERLYSINQKMNNIITATFPYFVDEWKITYDSAMEMLSPLKTNH